ncbi:MAG: glycosyl hydrolase [Verrucomicrobiales bacterium]
MDASFRNPAPDTRPGCYWYWINDNVTKEGITRDLEAMAKVGIGRAYIGHIFGEGARWETPVGKVPFMSDAWWEALQWAVKEADRCGVEIGFFNSPGWSQSGGPWVKSSQSMRYLAASETVVEGGKRVDLALPVPEIKTFPVVNGSKPVATGEKFTEKDYQDVRVIAFQQPEKESADIDMSSVKISSPAPVAKGPFKVGPKTLQIDLDRKDAVGAVQSLKLETRDFGHTLTCVVSISDDGRNFREHARHVEQRGHQGPRNTDPLLVSFPETKARYLRVNLTSTKPVTFSKLALSRRAVIAGYVRKQLGETSPSVLPPWDSYVWNEQGKVAAGSAVGSSNVINLTGKMDAKGRLVWDAPPGRWVVMRAGMIPIGTQCAPASPESRGLEVDKMSREHVRALFDGMMGEFLRRTPPQDRKALKYVIADSYETGPQNWTDGLVEKFEKRYGYSPVRFLPCLTGRVVDSPEVSTRFLWDWRHLISESIATEYVGGLREVANENQLTLWHENYGHWGFASEFLFYGSKSDQVGAEFWENNEPLHNIECRAASSCSHVYGRNDVYSEAFTSNRSFTQSPASMKQWCDWAYGAGVNHQILHVYIHQPDERKPGITAWFGTPFNRHNTWFEQSKAFIDYTRRCSVLLKQGVPVIDVAYYIGENAPSMQGPRDPELPAGYDFDYINSDVLINRATVKNGRITVPDGPSYAVLVLPKQTIMRPQVADTIRRLVRDGATVLGPKPVSSPSLAGFPASDQDLAKIAGEVWGAFEGGSPKTHAFGSGKVHDGIDLGTLLADLKVEPDVTVLADQPLLCAAAGAGKIGIGKKGGIVFHHRTSPEHEIYFLSNTTDTPVEFTASMRVIGRQPELWNADSGAISAAAAFSQRDGRTLVPLKLDASESIFVVFGRAIGPEVVGPAATNSPTMRTIAALDGDWKVRFHGQGAPGETDFTTLLDWTRHENESIRHYSGQADYETKFTLAKPGKGERTMLSLGDVGVIATVTVNGKTAGTVWTKPWRLDITDFVAEGQNTLGIRVTNSWHNRLAADAALPPGKRLSHASIPYSPGKDNLSQKNGLLGPASIESAILPTTNP